MREIVLFVEDSAHRFFFSTLLKRLAAELGVETTLRVLNARRGHGAVVREAKQFLRDLAGMYESLPDLVLIATDANCKGLNGRTKELAFVANFPVPVVLAIPDPHIERWLLIDSEAFKQVFGKGCDRPDKKCERSLYKQALIRAIRDTGRIPILGGIEFAEQVVQAMDLESAARSDTSFKRTLEGLKKVFQSWT